MLSSWHKKVGKWGFSVSSDWLHCLDSTPICHLCCNYNNQYMKKWYGQFAFSPLVQSSGIMKLTSTTFTCQRLVTCVLITRVMELKNRHLSQLDLRLKQMVVDEFWKSAKHHYRGRVWSSPRQARILWFYDCDKFLVIWGL